MSGPMLRDENGDCYRLDKKKAGSSRRKLVPARDIKHFVRVTGVYEDRVYQMMSKHGYRCLADFYEDSLASFMFLAKDGPLPPWADLNSK
jgi:hypothetical protein